MSKKNNDLPKITIREEYQKLVPKMPEEEYKLLKESIRTEGQFVPIIVNKNYVILDGHHRYRACIEENIAVKFVQKVFESEEDEKAFVIKCNLHRRQLTRFQRIEQAFKLEAIETEKARKRRLAHLYQGEQIPLDQTDPDEEKGKVIDKCAKVAGVSPNTYRKARYAIKCATEVQRQKLRSGEISIEAAYNEIIAAEQRKTESFASGRVWKLSEKITLIHEDFRMATDQQIPPDSVDLIIAGVTHSIDKHDGAYLGRLAVKILKSGGILALQVQHSYLFDVVTSIRSEAALRPLCLLVVKRKRPDPFIHPVKSTLGVYVIFYKGAVVRTCNDFESFLDLSTSQEEDSWIYDDTRVEEYLVSRLTEKDAVVCDPTCSTGYMADIVLRQGRRFIGLDNNLEDIELAVKRLGYLAK